MEFQHSLSLILLLFHFPTRSCTFPQRYNEVGYIKHSLGHLLLTFGADFNSFGSMFKSASSQLLGFTSHGSKSQAHQCSFGSTLTSYGSKFKDPHDIYILLEYILGVVPGLN